MWERSKGRWWYALALRSRAHAHMHNTHTNTHEQKHTPDFMFNISYVNDTRIYAFCCDKKSAGEMAGESGRKRESEGGRRSIKIKCL